MLPLCRYFFMIRWSIPCWRSFLARPNGWNWFLKHSTVATFPNGRIFKTGADSLFYDLGSLVRFADQLNTQPALKANHLVLDKKVRIRCLYYIKFRFRFSPWWKWSSPSPRMSGSLPSSKSLIRPELNLKTYAAQRSSSWSFSGGISCDACSRSWIDQRTYRPSRGSRRDYVGPAKNPLDSADWKHGQTIDRMARQCQRSLESHGEPHYPWTDSLLNLLPSIKS